MLEISSNVSCSIKNNIWRKERDCALSTKGMAWCKIKSKLENGEVILVFNVGLTLRGDIFIPNFQQNLNITTICYYNITTNMYSLY